MEKKYLFSPGPTMLPAEVLLKMAEPIMHHREPEFEKIYEEIREGLKYLFQTKNEVLIFASSGTGAMEGAVSNLLSKGDKALVVRGGKFGERWGEICKAYGIEFVPIDVPWGKAVDPREIQKALEVQSFHTGRLYSGERDLDWGEEPDPGDCRDRWEI